MKKLINKLKNKNIKARKTAKLFKLFLNNFAVFLIKISKFFSSFAGTSGPASSAGRLLRKFAETRKKVAGLLHRVSSQRRKSMIFVTDFALQNPSLREMKRSGMTKQSSNPSQSSLIPSSLRAKHGSPAIRRHLSLIPLSLRKTKQSIIPAILIIATFLTPLNSLQSSFNPEINYQGKLTDSAGVVVTDGTYNMRFNLYTTSTGGSALWTETLSSGNRVTVTSGLFSVRLGNVTSLAAVDFNQDLYLGITIGGLSTSPNWDGEMTPRKQIASVPSSFEADNLDGIDSTQFLRSDEPDTIASSSSSTLLSIVQSGIGNILSLFDGATEVFTILDGGNIGIGTTTPSQKLSIAEGDIQIDNTTHSNESGIIYKDDVPFIHNFNYGNNGTVTTKGYNTFVGEDAGNLTMGSTAVSNTQASYNTFVGNRAGYSNTTGYGNSFFGSYSGFSNTTGDQNIAMGSYSFIWNTTGDYNAAFGEGSLWSNTTGNYNSTLGFNSLYDNTTGSYNTTNGSKSLNYNSTGTSNIALGYRSGSYANGSVQNTTGDYNIFIGQDTKALADNDQNEIVIGYAATGIGSNTVVLGNDSVTTTALKGDVGIGTTSPAQKLSVDGKIYSTEGFQLPDGYVIDAQGDLTGSLTHTQTYVGNSDGTATATSSLTVTDTGRVGIGTDSPSYKLDVNGSIGNSNSNLVIQDLANADVTFFESATEGETKELRITGFRTGDQARTLQIGVGIDRANTVSFDGMGIYSFNGMISIPNAQGLQIETAGGTARDAFIVDSGDDLSIGAIHFDDIKFNVGALADAVVIKQTTGNVGIGTTTPVDKLDVAGKIAIDGVSRVYYPDQTDFVGTMYLGNGDGGASLSHTTGSEGQYNTFIGIGSGNANTTGNYNTANGYQSLYLNTTGNYNTANGMYSLRYNTTGYSNTANGMYSLRYNTTGSRNTANGYYSLFSNTTGYQNTANGYLSLRSNTTGNYNTANGYYSLYDVTEGIQNTAYGYNTGLGITTGDYNTIIGANVIGLDADLSNNIIIADGEGNRRINVDSAGKVGIGTDSPRQKLDISGNMVLSGTLEVEGDKLFLSEGRGLVYDAASNKLAVVMNTSGNFVDGSVFFDIDGNVGIGTTTPVDKLDVAGKIAIDGVSRVYYPDQTDFVGTMYLGNGDGGVSLSHTTGSEGQANTFIGIGSGNNNTTGNYNTANGMYSLFSNTTGANNTANGYQSLFSNTTGIYNTANGMYSLRYNTTGSRNTANGYLSLRSNTTGNYNTANGYGSLFSNTTGYRNTANGYNSLYDLTEGIQNTAYGYNTGRGITTGDYNTILGANVIGLDADLSNNIIIADGEGNRRINVDSVGNVGIGTTSPFAKLSVKGAGTTTGINFQTTDSADSPLVTVLDSGKVGIGTDSPGAKLHVEGDIFTDQYLGQDANTFLGIDVVGNNDLLHTTGNEGYLNTAIGNKAMFYLSTGWSNTAVGYQAGYGITTGGGNITMGMNAGYGITTGGDNLALGASSGNVTTGNNNVAIGNSAMTISSGAGYSTAVGDSALYRAVGNNNVGIGRLAGWGLLNGSSSVMIGNSSGQGVGNYDAEKNVFIGAGAGALIATGGSRNILLGYQTGNSLTTGTNNIAIGYDIELPSNTDSNQLNIGNLIFGTGIDGTGTSLSSGNVGIGTTSPTHTLEIAGSLWADSFRTDETTNHTVFVGDDAGGSSTGTYSTFVGEHAGENNTGASSSALGYQALESNTGDYSNAVGYNALLSNTGVGSNAIGYTALHNNTGVGSNAVGHKALSSNIGIASNAIGGSALRNNTGDYSNAVGGATLENNTGNYSNALGSSALQYNTGTDSNAMGYAALRINTGAYSSAIGSFALKNNTGANSNAFGHSTLLYNDGDYNTAIGDNAFNTWTADTGNAKTVASVDSDNNQVTITGHGFTTAVNLKATTTGTLPAGLSDASHHWRVIDANTLECFSDTFTDSGSGTLTLTPSVNYSNSTALGNNAEPDASNQVVLGDTNVTEVKTSGSIYASGTGDNYFAGNVGVGTTSPDVKFHIYTSGAGSATMFRLENADASATLVPFWDFYQGDNGKFSLGEADTENTFVIDTNKNVGIGTTSPAQKLSVDGKIYSTEGFQLPDGYVIDAQGDLTGSLTHTQTYVGNADGVATATSTLTVLDSGNVGIGTDSPSSKLDVFGPTDGSSLAIEFDATGHQDNNSTIKLLSGNATGRSEIFLGDVDDNDIGKIWYDNTNNSFLFFTNNDERMRIDSSGNVGIGTTDPVDKLDVAGKIAIDGVSRVYYPDQTDFLGTMYLGNGDGGVSLSHTTGDEGQYNTFIGIGSGNANTTGYQNTANGYASLYYNTTGNYNTANGYKSLSSNTTGNYNTANGYRSLYANTTGIRNTANGMYSLFSNTTGNYNTANGYYSLYDVTEGIQNTAIGYNTGRGITTGDYNTIIGANVIGLDADLSNNIIIADGEGNRRINVDSVGNVGIGTTSPFAKLSVKGAGTTTGVNFQTTDSADSPLVTVLDSGYVGIGTDSPDAKLQILEGNTRFAAIFGNAGSANGYTGIAFKGDNLKSAIFFEDTGSYGRGSLHFATDSAGDTDDVALSDAKMTIDSSGNVGIGTTSPGSLLTITNDNWISSTNSADTGYVNMFKVNSNDEIEVGGTLNIGSMTFSEDSGFITAMDMPVSSTPTAGDVEAYSFKVDGDNILTVYAEADGSGGIQNARVGIGTTTPSQALSVQGNILADAYLEYSPKYVGDALAEIMKIKALPKDKKTKPVGVQPPQSEGDNGDEDDREGDRSAVALGELDELVDFEDGFDENWAEVDHDTLPEGVRYVGPDGFIGRDLGKSVQLNLRAIQQLAENSSIYNAGQITIQSPNDENQRAEFNISEVGDMAISTAGKDIRLPDDNFSICSGGACPVIPVPPVVVSARNGAKQNDAAVQNAVQNYETLVNGTGNLIVENTAFIAGALGIGTPAPTRILDVYEPQSDPQFRISYDEDLYSEFNVSATGDLIISSAGGDISVLNENFRVCSDDGCPVIVNEIENTGNLVVENSLLALGNVGIGGTISPDYTLDVHGTLRAYGITDASDERLKTNIQSLSSSSSLRTSVKQSSNSLSTTVLENIKKLRGVTFEWKNEEFGTGIQIGMIAQELERVYPDLVSTDNDGFKSIQYGKFTAVLLEAVKDLINFGEKIEYRSARLEGRTTELEERNTELEQKVEGMENRIKALEQILRK